MGARQDPRGTPAKIGLEDESLPSVLPWNERLDKNDWIILMRSRGISIFDILYMRPSCHTRLNAFSMPRKTDMV